MFYFVECKIYILQSHMPQYVVFLHFLFILEKYYTTHGHLQCPWYNHIVLPFNYSKTVGTICRQRTAQFVEAIDTSLWLGKWAKRNRILIQQMSNSDHKWIQCAALRGDSSTTRSPWWLQTTILAGKTPPIRLRPWIIEFGILLCVNLWQSHSNYIQLAATTILCDRIP